MTLSAREAEVLAAIGRRQTNAEIAGQLFISVRTVESHVSSMLRKLQLPDRKALGAYARARASGLPVTTGVLVGRAADLASLGRSVAQPGLTTLVGPAGAGKTRLAREIAGGEGHLADLTALPAGAGTDLVAAMLLSALDGAETGGRTVLDELAAVVRRDPPLLVLDNCEHVLDGAAAVAAALIERTPVRLLATSRERLAIPGEHVHPVGPLPPDEAVELFVQRAAAVIGESDLDPDTVAAVCERTDRLPLALELAAARLAVLSLTELSRAVDSGTELLDGGDRSRPRHRSVRSMLSWSYDLLSAADQAAHRRLAVIAGPFRLPPAQAVAGQGGSVAAAVARLVEASLLSRVDAERYRQLELVRADALARLTPEERTQAEDGLMAWARSCLAADGGSAMDESALRAAAEAAVRRGGRPAVELLEQLGGWWISRHAWSDAIVTLEHAARTAHLPAAAMRAADLAWSQWRGDDAVRLFELAADLAADAGDGAAVVVACVSCIELRTRFAATTSTPVAEGGLRALLARAQTAALAGSLASECRVALGEAWVLAEEGDLVAAISAAQRAVAAAAAVGEAVLESAALDALSGALLESGDVEAMAEVAERRFCLRDRLGGSPRADMEHTDVLDMATDGPRLIGQFPLALERAQMVLDRERARGLVHVGWARVVLAEFFLGKWDDCLGHEDEIVASWTDEGEPAAAWLAPSIAVAAAICGYRADATGEQRWLGIFRRLAGVQRTHDGLLDALTADVHLFHGRRSEATSAVADPPEQVSGLWRSLYAAVRAEAVGGAAIAAAEPLLFGNAYAAALLDRARGDLAAAISGFAGCGAAFQAARTRLMLDAGDASARELVDRLLRRPR